MIINGISGNSESIHIFHHYFKVKQFRVLVLNGPSYIGKQTFVKNWLSDHIENVDLLEPEASISGIREIKSFLEINPLFSSWKIILINNADNLSEPAQDALLKILEEPPSKVRIILITNDCFSFLPALKSRLQYIIRWTILSNYEMDEFIESTEFIEDKNARFLCAGRPGLYNFLAGKCDSYFDLYKSISKLIESDDPLFESLPEVILNLKNKHSIEKDAAAQVIRLAIQEKYLTKPNRASNFYRFAAVLLRYPEASAEIHWQRAVLGL